MIRPVLAIVVIVVAGLLLYFSPQGYFKQPSLEMRRYPELHLLFRERAGEVKKVGADRREVYEWATGAGIKCEMTFTRFLKNEGAGEVRTISGCVLEAPLGVKSAYSQMSVPEQEYLVGTFEGLPRLADQRVYRAVVSYLQENRKKLSDSPIFLFQTVSGRFFPQPVETYLYMLSDK